MPLPSVRTRIAGPVGATAARQGLAGADRRYWLWLAPLLVALSALTRIPSFARPLWNPDEGFLATQARQLADGGTLYHDVVDRKPPFMPWLYQGAFALFGDDSLWPLRVAAIVAVAVGAVFAASLARRRWGDRAGWMAGVVYVLLSIGINPEDTQAATFEVFMLPWTVAAMWCADRARWGRAGLAVAAAILTKQTGGAVLLPVLFLLWRTRAGWLPLIRLTAGTALPVLGVALAFGPARFAYWMATGSGAYVSADGAGLHAMGRALGSLSILCAAALPLLIALGHVLRRRRERLRDVADQWVWLAASGLAVAVGFQFYGHYFLQLIPPLALLAAAALRELRARQATVALTVTSVFAAAFIGWGFAYKRGELDHAQRLAQEVGERTVPEERVLLWSMHPEGYWFAARKPASRYLTAGFLSNFSGGRDGIRTGEQYAMDGAWPYFLRELRQTRPTLIVDDSRDAPYAIPRMPTLRGYVDRHYTRVATVDGAVIYLREER
ncbi:ArnT family glycosyltransferase [Streptomyces sp. NPDC048172]|uniref:ArnT family glycosyltransferase n=1 Tax=Streptomyces sp. NPDC048172 TaxID=3365505 RepID=UPI0037110208